jgi:tetratricopeptide (TPR) repeat protein
MRNAWLPFLLSLSGSYAGALLDFSYGVLERQRGDEKSAAGYFAKAYEADPLAMPLVRIIAESHMVNGDRAAALEAYERVIAARPDEPSIALEYGDFLGEVGKGDTLARRKREEVYGKVLEAMPGAYIAIERLIRTARERGDDDRARELLETLTADSEQSVRYYVATTKSLYDSRDEEAAARIDARFAEAMESHPGWAGIARAASDHFRQSNRLGEAIGILRKHLEARPSSLDLKIRLGILLFSDKREDDAVKVLREVLEVHPRKALAHESLAKHFRQNGKLTEARGHAAELLGIRGGTSEEFLELAEELTADGEFRAARILLEKAVFRHADDAKLMMKLAIATSRDPDTKDSASRLFREAEAMLENPAEMDPAFLLESSKELLAQGQVKAAEERLRNAIRTFPKEAKKETAAAMRALAGIWISENRNLDAARALISRAEAMEE